MTINKIKLVIVVCCLISIVCFKYSWAENQIGITESDISIDMSPEMPGPYDNVTISISSYSTNLNKANISWNITNGVKVSGIGKNTINFKTGPIDIPIIVNVNIQPVESAGSISRQIVIHPAEIEIMWEAIDGYAPPFYKGKILPITGSRIKAVAIPNTTTIKSGNGDIAYIWKNNGSVIQNASGYNKNYYIFKNSLLEDANNIEVSASSIKGDYNAEKSIIIPLYKPKLIFYKKTPTEGTIYNMALLNESPLDSGTTTIIAEPYFMSLKNNDVSYNWQINNKTIPTPVNKKELTIKPSSTGGYATIDLTVENISELFQKVRNTLKLSL